MERLRIVDIAKGIGIVLVVLGHTAISIRPLIYLFHMPLFFILSGMLFKEERTRHYGSFVLSCAQKTLVPYAFLFVLSIPLANLMSGFSLSAKELWLAFFMPKVALPHPNPTLWFFTALFWVQLVYGGLLHLRRRADWSVLLLAAFVTAVGCVYMGEEWLPLSLVRSWYFVFFFAVGHWMRLHLHDIRRFGSPWVHLMGVVCCVVLFAFLFDSSYVNRVLNVPELVARHGLGVLVAFTFSGAVMWLSSSLAHVPALEWAGRNTVVIFPLHIFPIQFLTYFLVAIGLSPNPKSDPFCLAGSAFAFLCMIPVVRFCSANWPVVFGRRGNRGR